MRSFIILILLVNSTLILARPTKVEVIFLSLHSKKVSKIVLKKNLFALNTNELSCDPVGDLCFDPQVGLYKKERNEITLVDLPDEDENPSPSLLKGMDTSLVHCDRNYHFDVFCGKSKKESKALGDASLEVWIDVSSSLREYDGLDRSGECNRKSFIRRLQSECDGKMKVQVFNTSIKEMGSLDILCDATGLNDQKRLMKWIEESVAKNLVIVTDINELTKEFADYLASIGGVLRGDAVDRPIVAAEMVNIVSEFSKLCK